MSSFFSRSRRRAGAQSDSDDNSTADVTAWTSRKSQGKGERPGEPVDISSGDDEPSFDEQSDEALSLTHLLDRVGGSKAYQAFKLIPLRKSGPSAAQRREMSSTRPLSKRKREPDYTDFNTLSDPIEDSGSSAEYSTIKKPRLRLRGPRRDGKGRTRESVRRSTRRSLPSKIDVSRDTSTSEAETSADVDSSADELSYLVSDVGPQRKSRARATAGRPSYVSEDGTIFDRAPRANQSTRHSGRSTRHQGAMLEVGEDQIHRADSPETRSPALPKVVNVIEVFKTLPRTDEFRNRHLQQCDSCGQGTNTAPLVYCQGCAFAYHKNCLGNRSTREHLVTKIASGDFILQCRRCIRFAQKKDTSAPDQSKCHDCRTQGLSCQPFRARKTPAQEQKDRESNGGEDPIYPVPPSLVNNPSNVLFRCVSCSRGFHYEHLPPRSDVVELDNSHAAAMRFAEYAQDWKCKDCAEAPAKIRGLVAWKPLDEDTYNPAKAVDEINEDDKVYLVRWENLSYFRAIWMPGAWVWGIAAGPMLKSFLKRDDAIKPKMRTEDAIPEEYLRVDIVLDVSYTSIVQFDGEDIDKARIKEVKKALIKYKGLGYEDAVWETPPVPEDGDRWTDFVTAYYDWVGGKYVHIPKAVPLKARLEKARGLDFASKLEKKKQPENLIGGELMKYQLEGLNWLYYKWYTQSNAILADEMGLGKTIQIIGFLGTLVSEWNCFPFLIVVPNATCANWRREIKHWAPGLRVVAYFGSQAARELAYRYELFPRQSKDPRCHIVVTSYEAAADPGNRRFFKSVAWQALIVDEGQRLKSDKTLLYAALMDLKIPFRILLTGTPLQNNQRELYNLLQFLDEGYDAASMEAEYKDLDNEKVARLHELIRPFFLRRTKAQVLTFLPPMAQIILPVSMSLVQKKLYRSILAKNPDLLRALFKEKRDLRASERGSLNNILMQLRKCLCHPFVYSKSIEEREVSHSASHRNLVEASGKLQLLEQLLPKLRERGHRVLIFSQFLDMLTMIEDFLDGLGMQYERLDGSMGSLQKQKRIDRFNAPNSEVFAFLLSTRAGGVGINLATADTVIIMDPDFNPHQDIQALSRAHRIGQKNKVLCFQIVTRSSAEEKIVQMGRTKIALDHILIEQMDAEDASEKDLTSILTYGAAELFEDEGDKETKYDPAEIDKLLDRSQIENTKAGEDQSAESQFSFARIWANNNLEDSLPAAEAQTEAPDPGLWDKILKERERVAAAEAAAAREAFGRGRRHKQVVDYGASQEVQDASGAPLPAPRMAKEDDDNDTDFQADSDAESKDEDRDSDSGAIISERNTPKKNATFQRVNVRFSSRNTGYHGLPTPPAADFNPAISCIACRQMHVQGNCPLKKAGVEYCNLCGTAHFGHARICPHINSETQVRAMLAALKQSPEAGHLVKEARKYLTGVKGTLVQKKKQEEDRRHAEREIGYRPVFHNTVAVAAAAATTVQNGQVVGAVGQQQARVSGERQHQQPQQFHYPDPSVGRQ
ncbi:hypothetical protein ANO11243_090590 [Dothideomycetidae sp. 11243]|nr:hypothetical protein ANO11243_090590 [fungal sp. No.11243]